MVMMLVVVRLWGSNRCIGFGHAGSDLGQGRRGGAGDVILATTEHRLKQIHYEKVNYAPDYVYLNIFFILFA